LKLFRFDCLFLQHTVSPEVSQNFSAKAIKAPPNMMITHHYREKAHLFVWILNPENFMRMPLHICVIWKSCEALKRTILNQLREHTWCRSFKIVGFF